MYIIQGREEKHACPSGGREGVNEIKKKSLLDHYPKGEVHGPGGGD
jgi:hypothetical protein